DTPGATGLLRPASGAIWPGGRAARPAAPGAAQTLGTGLVGRPRRAAGGGNPVALRPPFPRRSDPPPPAGLLPVAAQPAAPSRPGGARAPPPAGIPIPHLPHLG